MRKIFLISLLFILVFSAYGENIPQPTGWVNDFANVIDKTYQDKISALIQELEEKTTAEIAVVTIDSIAPYDEKEYARLLFDNWRPGKKGKDNGVLVFLAVKERRWRIETGYGVEGILPDGLCGEIGRTYMVPYFKEGNYGAGLYYGVSQIAAVIARENRVDISGIEQVKPQKETKELTDKLFICLFALFFFTLWNIPWPIFIGLPFTLIFAFAMSNVTLLAGVLTIIGYFIAMFIRYRIWRNLPSDKRKSFLWIIIWGLFVLKGYGRSYYGGGGFGGGNWGGGGGDFGGGGGGFGGGGGGGGGAGGGF